MASKQAIDSFLSCRRIAVVGVSRGPKDFSEVQPPPEAALLMTPPAATDQVVRECAEAGVKRVWMHRGGGAGAVSPEAVVFCRERGIEVVDGECPFMFLPGTSWFHGVHRFFKRLGGRLPS
jgi:predicted CoA-binding protein